MTTRLIIKDFGPISSADVEIGKFTVPKIEYIPAERNILSPRHFK